MARLIISRRRQHINIYNGHRHGIDEKNGKKKSCAILIAYVNLKLMKLWTYYDSYWIEQVREVYRCLDPVAFNSR